MSDIWDLARLKQYIDQGIEESSTLDYKAAASLSKSDEKKKREITKDVSAMANSAGGILIYGISEHQDIKRKHLPEKIDPINRPEFPKEWLEHIINNISPKINGVIIHPIPLDTAPHHVAYVIEIPEGTTAHQAMDKRYYKRFNFESVAMEDYEVRLVMARIQHPKIELEFAIEIRSEPRYSSSFTIGRSDHSYDLVCELTIYAINVGNVYASYISAFVEIPRCLSPPYQSRLSGSDSDLVDPRNLTGHFEITQTNLVRDRVSDRSPMHGSYSEGVGRYVPLLPKTSLKLGSEYLGDQFIEIPLENLTIRWQVHADNAPISSGEIAVTEIELFDKREDEDDLSN